MSSVGSLTPGLKQFIAQHIKSVEQVEILSLFASNPERGWTAAEVFRSIQSSEKSVAESLDSFTRNELLVTESPGIYLLKPKTPELAEKVAELAVAYRQRRVSVIECIYGRPAKPLQNFADAFRLRKEK